MPFPNHVNRFQPFGMEGDAGSTNTHNSQVAYQGSLVAGDKGAIVGRFGWVTDGAVNNTSTESIAPNGFMRNEGTAQIMTIFEESSLVVPKGFECVLYTQGEFWAKLGNAGKNGNKIFARLADGVALAGEAGGSVSGAVETDYYLMGDAAEGETNIISTWSKRA